MKNATLSDFTALSHEFGFTVAEIKTVDAVECGGKGFDEVTGKMVIQFEPKWFKRQAPYTPSGKWSLNGVERQAREWECFNDAFAKNPNAAMESTSIGRFQVMGFHWKKLGFKSVGAMWDYAKESEVNQLRLGLRLIQLSPAMNKALKSHTWDVFAYFYNGKEYRKFNYDNRLATAYKKFI